MFVFWLILALEPIQLNVSGAAAGELLEPCGVVIHEQRLILFDGQSARLFLFDRGGQLLKTAGGIGEGPAEFQVAGTLFAHGEYIVASGAGKAVVFDWDLNLIDTVKTPNAILIAWRKQTQIFMTGAWYGAWRYRFGIVVDARGRRTFAPAGLHHRKNGYALGDHFVVAGPERLYAVDNLSNAITVHDWSGAQTGSLSPHLAGIEAYDPEKHGHLSRRWPIHKQRAFIASFDQPWRNGSFAFTHPQHGPCALITWRTQNSPGTHYVAQLFGPNDQILQRWDFTEQTYPVGYDVQNDAIMTFNQNTSDTLLSLEFINISQ